MSEASTLNKLIILYLLEESSFPLTGAQIAECLVSKEYMQYFQLQEQLSELEKADLIIPEEVGTNTLYHISENGEKTIYYFEKRISSAIREEIRRYLKENAIDLRNAASTEARYYRTTEGDYAVHLSIKEGSSQLMDLTVTVPSEEEAEGFALNFPGRAQKIYADIMRELMR